MFNYRIMAIIKREIREKLLSRAFIFMTILFPFLMFGGIGIQFALHQDEAKEKVAIVTEYEPLTQSFQKELLTSDVMKSGKLSLMFFTMNRLELKTYLEEKKKDLLEGQITGVVYIPLSSLKDKRIEYYSKTPTNLALSRKLEGPINKVLIDSYFSNRALSPSDLDFARKSLDFSGFKVTKEQNLKEEGYGNLILAYIFSFLLYISLLVTGQMMLQSVIEEKSSRIVEVILSSVSPKELMTGKIIGNAFV